MLNTNSLSPFKYIGLNGLNEVKMLNRKDTKYVFNMVHLQPILDKLLASYKILRIEDKLSFDYDNRYFDTEDFLFYYQHHNESRNRYKIRFRNYSSTNKTFFEIKTKNNKNRTIKKRLINNNNNVFFNEAERQLIENIIGISPDKLKPSINIKFNRITLVDNLFKERLTFDTNLIVKDGLNTKKFEKLVIAEIKQHKYNPKSSFIKILQNMKIPEMKFSKYCMGMIHLKTDLKQNRFKPKLYLINKILSENN